MEKSARKPSSDPNQQKLRSHKSEWNQDVSTLISELIALKRGLNGRGDPKAGLPPSSIKDPLPSEIGQKLSDVANEYAAVLSKAKSIITEQNDYSHSRKKKIQADWDPELIAEASWKGSRLWTKLHFLFSRDKETRRLLYRLLDDSVEIRKQLKELHSRIVKSDERQIPESLEMILRLAHHFEALQRTVDALNKKGTPEEPDKEAVKKKRDMVEEEEKKSYSPEISVPSFHSIPEPKVVGIQSEEFNKIKKQLPYIESVVNHLISQKLAELSNTYFELYQFVVIFDQWDKSDKTDEKPEEKVKIFNMVKNLYGKIFETAKKYLVGNSFEEMVTNLRLKTSEKNDQELQKHAQEALKRWFRTQKMKFNPSFLERLMLDVVRDAGKVRDALAEFLDVIEDKEATPETLANSFKNRLVPEISALLTDGVALGKDYISSYALGEINQIRIPKVKSLINDLIRINKSFQ